MHKQLIGLDHLMISTPDLDALKAQYRRLGFAVTPYRANDPMGGGKTGGRGGNRLVLFQPTDDRMTNYLEFAYADPDHAVPFLKQVLGRVPTLAMLVHAARDLPTLDEKWQAQGFPACLFYEHDTQFIDPDTGVSDRLHFKVLVPDAPRGPMTFNACEVTERDHYLRPDWLAHENTARHWTRVRISTEDLTAMRTHFDAIYGADLPPQSPVGITLGAQTVEALDNAEFASIYGSLSRRSDGSQADTAIDIAVASLGTARSILEREDVPFELDEQSQSLTISAAQAGGIILTLVEAPR